MFFSPSRIYIYIYMPARNKTSVCGRKNHEGRQVGLQYKKDSTWSALEVPTFTIQNYLLVQVNLGEIFWAQIELLRINHRIIKVLLRLSQLFVFLKLSSFACNMWTRRNMATPAYAWGDELEMDLCMDWEGG